MLGLLASLRYSLYLKSCKLCPYPVSLTRLPITAVPISLLHQVAGSSLGEPYKLPGQDHCVLLCVCIAPVTDIVASECLYICKMVTHYLSAFVSANNILGFGFFFFSLNSFAYSVSH